MPEMNTCPDCKLSLLRGSMHVCRKRQEKPYFEERRYISQETGEVRIDRYAMFNTLEGAEAYVEGEPDA